MTDTKLDEQAERIAAHWRRFNNRLANPRYDWMAWEDLSERTRAMLTATARGLLEAGVIVPGPAVLGGIEETDGSA